MYASVRLTKVQPEGLLGKITSDNPGTQLCKDLNYLKT